MNFIAIIPARYASTRFPGKPLALLGGKPIIEHVCSKVASVVADTFIATDDDRIFSTVESFGGRAIMTSPDHRSGTDRIEEAVTILSEEIRVKSEEAAPSTFSCQLSTDDTVVINVQGDEPFIHPSQIEAVCRCFDDPATQIATLGKPFINEGDTDSTFQLINNPNSPKIVVDNNGYAMYFSRSVIPFIRGKQTEEWPKEFPFLKHIGLYAYRRRVLHEITRLPQSSLEKAESLEQLRWLQNGYRIRVALTDVETIGIDTPEDLERAEQFLKRQGCKT